MSFKNFVPIVEAERIQKELDKQMVFLENCNREYEGTVEKVGDTVEILNAGKPTIHSHVDGRLHEHTSEELEGSSIFMPIKHIEQVAFGVGDIDKHIAKGNLYDVYLEETKKGFGDKMDAFIASLAADDNIERYTPANAVTAANILDYLDYCKVYLEEQNVTESTELTVTGSPKFCDLLRKAYINKGTDKATTHMQNGQIGTYNNMIVKMSNNVYKTNESDVNYEWVQIKTNKALAFVKPLLKLEPWRNHKIHRDELSAFVYYDGMVTRPKEIITLKVKY